MLEQLRDDGPTEPAAETVDPPAPPAVPASAADSVEDPAAARRARLEALSARDRAHVDHKAKLAAQDKAAREATTLREELEALKARESKRLDPDTLKDPRALLRFAEDSGIPATAMIEAIKEAIANPERAAAVTAREALRKEIDPEVKALRDEIAALKRRDDEREQALAQHRQQAEEQAAANEFFQFTTANAASSPRAAAFLDKFGGGEFYKLAARASGQVPEGAGPQAVLDVIEENLTQLAVIYGQEANPSSPKATPSRAAAKANVVTNALAGQRSTVVEEEDFASLPFDERVRRVKQRH